MDVVPSSSRVAQFFSDSHQPRIRYSYDALLDKMLPTHSWKCGSPWQSWFYCPSRLMQKCLLSQKLHILGKLLVKTFLTNWRMKFCQLGLFTKSIFRELVVLLSTMKNPFLTVLESYYPSICIPSSLIHNMLAKYKSISLIESFPVVNHLENRRKNVFSIADIGILSSTNHFAFDLTSFHWKKEEWLIFSKLKTLLAKCESN